MTTTVKELIEYLKKIPLDTEVNVVVAEDCGYQTCASFVPLDLDPATGNAEYIDMKGNPFIKSDSDLWNRSFLDLGDA